MNSGDTAWVLVCAALVMLMTPGLALFYGGMVRSRGVLNMLMMSLGSLGVVGVLWVVYGYSGAFGSDLGGLGLLGSPSEFFGMSRLVGQEGLSDTIPTFAFAAFQAMFAILTVALISGAIADRARFGPWLLFAGLWATLVYFPVAHWVFAFDETNAAGEVTAVGGWIANRIEAIDFAGGTAVHINAGAAALALVLVLGPRSGWPKETGKPHNLPLVVLGAGLLWFGWFGFNAGSALTAGTTAAIVFVNTLVGASAAMLAWMLVERLRHGRPTTLGAVSGIIAGLVAITPACSAVTPLGAIAIGAISGAVCALAVELKYRLRYDDSLDVVGVHLVGGLVGTLLVGLFASASAPAGVAGLFYGGGLDQLWRQAVGALAVFAYSLVLSLGIAWVVRGTVGFRLGTADEDAGIDETEHAETGYHFGEVRNTLRGSRTGEHGSVEALEGSVR
ncbi:ammonium transporter [Actinopolyspora erythraea]|uniref:Ammonium transporter n=1 Tax=Actinopolyspora erythraea TaxID=414996 RepID=A0A099D6M3_9ACTN|nr:ammonium transporter [Actinopolyspora erythraea]ASU78116.1 ammonium transporter [Actinopolyspora erythraea]KGI81674.1 ammonia channel protein [Actinopolyspora erythraea]